MLNIVSTGKIIRLLEGVLTGLALRIKATITSILRHLQFMNFHLHFPIFLNQPLHILNRHRCSFQFLVFLLQVHQLAMNIIRTHPLSL